MNTLPNLVRTEILNFLSSLSEKQIFHNELDFQVQLAFHLYNSGKFSKIFMEYYVPCDLVEDYPWKTQIYIDIVVELRSQFYLIELKYKTESIKQSKYTCFGKELTIDFLKNQGARNHACYDFWRDVKRIECIQENFSDSILGGVAIFLTNSKSYWDGKVSQTSDYAQFALKYEFPTAKKKWITPDSKGSRKHPIELRKNYIPKWEHTSMILGCDSDKKRDLWYCMIEVLP